MYCLYVCKIGKAFEAIDNREYCNRCEVKLYHELKQRIQELEGALKLSIKYILEHNNLENCPLNIDCCNGNNCLECLCNFYTQHSIDINDSLNRANEELREIMKSMTNDHARDHCGKYSLLGFRECDKCISKECNEFANEYFNYMLSQVKSNPEGVE
jgi:CRISPR/Cas system-associated endonuclease Cas3-HD